MWHVQYRGSRQGDMIFIGEEKNSEFTVTPWLPNLPPVPVARVYGINDFEHPSKRDDDELRIVDESMDSDEQEAYSVIGVDETTGLPELKSIPLQHAYPGISQTRFSEHRESFQNSKVKRNTRESDEGSVKKDYDQLYGNRGPILMACFVRLCMICHNVLTVWRVVESYNDSMYWLLVLGNFFLIFEGQIVVLKRAGIEYSW